MRLQLLLVFYLASGVILSQDSLSRLRLKIFDCSFLVGSMTFGENTDLDHINNVSTNKGYITDAKGYQHHSMDGDDSNVGNEFGIVTSFKFTNTRDKILKRIRPRLGLYYTSRDFFNYQMSYATSTHIDSLYYTDPKLPPLLIDSLFTGTLQYKYCSKQVAIELGANIDIFNWRYFIFYSGVLVNQGFSIENKFSFNKKESYEISRYPNQSEGRVGTVKNINIIETGPPSYNTRIILPIGIQHRFSNRHSFSPGFFVELRPCMNIYTIKNEKPHPSFFFFVSAGLRFSLRKHK